MMRTVAIIPARGGSKGIPRKNIIDFCGYPLVSWTIACARRCPRIDAVYVSTDDAEIAEVSRHYGAEIIERPANIAGDTSSSESAVIHACEVIRQKNLLPDAVIMMQATSPLRESSRNSPSGTCLNVNLPCSVSGVASCACATGARMRKNAKAAAADFMRHPFRGSLRTQASER